MAGFIGLKLFARCHPCLTHIRLQMDNTTAVHQVNKIRGTISFNLCMLALAMWEWAESRNIHLSAVYLPDQLNFIADTLSHLINLDSEWMLNPSIFRQVCSTYSISKEDLFVTRVNNQVPNSVSWFPHPEEMATVSWSGHLSYALPPFSQIMKCLKKIQTDKAKVLFVAPVWRSRPWFPVLLSMLYDCPLLLLSVSNLLILPSYPERLPQKQVTLVLWRCPSPIQPDYEVSEKDPNRQGQSPFCGSSVEIETMVSGPSFNAVRLPTIASECFKSVDTTILPREAPAETSDSGSVAAV